MESAQLPPASSPATEAPEKPRSRFSLRDLPLERRRMLASIGFLVALYVGFGIAKPVFFSESNFWTMSQQGSILLLVALGATFVVMMGMIDLSVGSLVTLSAMVLAVTEPDLGSWAVLAAIGVAGLAGAMNGLIVTIMRVPSFLVTLGTLSIITGLTLVIGSTYEPLNNSLVEDISVSEVLGRVPIITVWAVLLTLLLAWVARYTVYGRSVYAIGGGERVSQIVGMPIKRYKVAAFALSGLTCGVAGVVLAGLSGAGSPGIGASFLLSAVAAIAVGGTALTGGIGGPWGTVIGAAIITVLTSGLVVLQVSEQVQNIVQGSVVIGAVYFTMDRSRGLIIK